MHAHYLLMSSQFNGLNFEVQTFNLLMECSICSGKIWLKIQTIKTTECAFIQTNSFRKCQRYERISTICTWAWMMHKFWHTPTDIKYLNMMENNPWKRVQKSRLHGSMQFNGKLVPFVMLCLLIKLIRTDFSSLLALNESHLVPNIMCLFIFRFLVNGTAVLELCNLIEWRRMFKCLRCGGNVSTKCYSIWFYGGIYCARHSRCSCELRWICWNWN